MASSIETTSTTTTLKNNGNTYLSVDANDNVGIGTAAPETKVHIEGDVSGLNDGNVMHIESNGNGGNRGINIGQEGNGSQARMFLQGYHSQSVTNYWDILINPYGGNVGIGTSANGLFNAVGGTAKLAVTGSSSSTNIIGNTESALAIINTDVTANNTAGLHFARADTDDTPNYVGASIVAQFKETQATGQYPSADLNFLTSPSQNAAPTLKMTLDTAGRLTTPFQPGVGSYTSVARTSNGQMSNYSGATGNFNVGSHFNASTGVFTAPIAGRYLVAVTGKSDHNGVARGLFRLFINGGQYDEIVETYGSYQDVGSAQVINLSASDYLHVTIEGASASAPYRCSFNAILIA